MKLQSLLFCLSFTIYAWVHVKILIICILLKYYLFGNLNCVLFVNCHFKVKALDCVDPQRSTPRLQPPGGTKYRASYPVSLEQKKKSPEKKAYSDFSTENQCCFTFLLFPKAICYMIQLEGRRRSGSRSFLTAFHKTKQKKQEQHNFVAFFFSFFFFFNHHFLYLLCVWCHSWTEKIILTL